jgi:hypothetical protein
LHGCVTVTADVGNLAAMVCAGCCAPARSGVCARCRVRAGALPC